VLRVTTATRHKTLVYKLVAPFTTVKFCPVQPYGWRVQNKAFALNMHTVLVAGLILQPPFVTAVFFTDGDDVTYENLIGKKLKSIRISQKLSKQDMADYLWILVGIYNDYEAGRLLPENLPPEFAIWLFI